LVLLSVGRDSVRFYGGSFVPNLLISIPRTDVLGVSIVKRTQARWDLDVLEFSCVGSEDHSKIGVAVLGLRLGMPVVRRGPTLRDDLRQAVQALK
jgi:hypothetical protein